MKNQREVKNELNRDLLGCDFAFLKTHLTDRFQREYNESVDWNKFMTSDTYWVDHIIPCAAFDLKHTKAQKLCYHYSNLRIMYKRDNYEKSDFILGIRGRNLKNKFTGDEAFWKLKDYKGKLV